MSAPSLPLIEGLTRDLRSLCAQPSSTGQIDDLSATADLVAGLLRGLGMQVRVVSTPGAPVVIGRLGGRSERWLLLYHAYDSAPPGPWREWSHEPFQLAERDGALYGRGVAAGKGPLVAHLQAIQSLLDAEGGLPCGVVVVAEGEGMAGSPHLAAALAAQPELVRADAALGSAGERDAAGMPFCYRGCKGLLKVRLSARSTTQPLPAGLAAGLHNPLWRLTWALASIKGDDEDIRIPGFYDMVEGPSRTDNAILRRIAVAEEARKTAWGVSSFLFGLGGAALMRAEVTLPTCNLSAVSCEPGGELSLVPAAASAVLDFELVPNQEPPVILSLLREHLIDRGFADIEVEPLPGRFAPARTPSDSPFIGELAAALAGVYGAEPSILTAGPFALPLQIVGEASGAALACVGVARPDSATLGPDEHLAADDLARHAMLLSELLCRMG